jgi:hypothetical protein
VNDAIAATREWPSLSIDGSGNLYFVWMDNRDGNNNIYFSYSMDGGNTFSPDTLIHNGTPDDKYPGIAAGQESDALSEVHIAWTRVDTTMYVRGTPVPVGISGVYFAARETQNGILLKWEKTGYPQGAVWLLSRRESHTVYETIAQIEGENSCSYLDPKVKPGKTYCYSLTLFDTQGNSLATSETSIITNPQTNYPCITVLSNPCKTVTIRYSLGYDPEVCVLRIYDVQGRVVKTYSLDATKHSGTITWNGTDERGRQCPAGIYFAALSTAGALERREKFILLR